MQEVVQFFRQLCRLLKPGSSILDHILDEILEDTADLPIYEVFSISIPIPYLQLNCGHSCSPVMLVNAQIICFLRPVVEGKAKGYSSPLLRVHTEVDEHKLREAIKAVGGNLKASLPFLEESSTSDVLKPTKNGKQRKCCTIPHAALSRNIIAALIDRGKNIYLYYSSNTCI